jgi:DNA modification methylase
MPESVTDRPTKSHEYIFLLVKSPRYYYDANAIREPSTYLQPNSPESIKSPYGQGFTRRANNGVGFGHGTDKEMRERDTVRGSIGVIKNPLNSARRSGNKERKINVSGRLNTHVGSSIPWEGATRNKRTVWNIATKPFSEAHFAVFPPEIPEICIKAGCPEQGWVLDPFAGSGTTLMVAANLWRNAIGIEINPEYCELIERRMEGLETNLFEMGGR